MREHGNDETAPTEQVMLQIGEVAARTDLSIRTLRHWEEMGLITPTSRSAGGFRLYSDEDVAQIKLLRFMKPLNFTLEQMRDLLALRSAVGAGAPDRLSGLVWPQSADPVDDETSERVSRDLENYVGLAEKRLEKLRQQVIEVEEFVQQLGAEARRGSHERAAE